MTSRMFLVVVATITLVAGACSSGGDGSLGERPLLVDSPTTLVGVLDVSVEEGPVGDDDISEVNFGAVELDDGYVLVEIPGDVLRSSGVARADIDEPSKFSVEISGPGSVFDDLTPNYLVSRLQPAD